MIIDILESVPRKYHPRIHTQHNDKRDECHLLQKEAHDEKRWSLHIYYGIYILRKYHLLAMVMTDCTIYGQPGIQRSLCARGMDRRNGIEVQSRETVGKNPRCFLRAKLRIRHVPMPTPVPILPSSSSPFPSLPSPFPRVQVRWIAREC